MKKILFACIILSFVIGSLYVFYELYPLLNVLPSIFQGVGFVIAFLMITSMFIFFAIGKRLPIYLAAILYKVGTGWLMLLIYAVPIALIIRGGFSLLTSYANLSILGVQTVQSAFVLLLVLVFVACIGYFTYNKKERINVVLSTKKAVTKDIKIVFISDMHLGYAIEKKELTAWVEKINKEQPDLILIGGDIVDFSLLPVLYYQLGDLLKQFKATYGVYACMGNHDYMAGAEASMRFMKESGIAVLRDQAMNLDDLGITLIGRDDLTNRSRKSLEEIKNNITDTTFSILLDHQPFNLNDAVANNIDLQLSGHTHRGQVWPISLITDRIFENSHGYLKKENTSIYVSSGIGIWGGRYRIGTQSEYVVIDLKKTP